MMKHFDNGTVATSISRRGFVAGASGLTFAFTFGAGVVGRLADAVAADGDAKLNGWVTIGADNSITIMVPAAEMGQGVQTSLPLIVAEELDADWSKVKTEFAPPIPKNFGNPHPILRGGMATVASISVAGYYQPLRIAGAQARRVLLDNAAAQWNVPVDELTTEPSVVVHEKSGRRMSYGDIAKTAKVPAEPPAIKPEQLKPEAQFRLIGRQDIGRVDVPGKVTGTAKYGIDVQIPGMVYAAVVQAPMEGAAPDKVDATALLRIPGVLHTIRLPNAVAVIGETFEAAKAGHDALKITWDTSKATGAKFDSEQAKEEYARNGRDPNAKAMEWAKTGDAPRAIRGAVKKLEAAYWSEHCYHAQMEPMNCVAKVGEDGKSAEIWTGTQSNMLAAVIAAGVLQTTPDKIRVHQHLLGGGYGRRVWNDAAGQAVALANIVKKPVKMILLREDDIAAARPRPMTHHIMKAGLDANNNLVGWHHRLVSENVDAVAAPPRFQATGGKDLIGMRGLEQPFYSFPNMLADVVREQRGMRVHAWRGIGSGYNKFASECFLDEIAQAKGVDPVALRLELAKDHPRAIAVIKAAAEMSEFSRRREGRGLGIAFADYHDTFSAGVAEVSVDQTTGKIKVHNYWIAVDPGIVIQPDNVHAQLESAVIYGLSAALLEELTLKEGAVQQSNFNDYPVLRMSDVPPIHTKIVAANSKPTGMGEIGVVSVAPAIANAMFQLTGKRLRHLPMSPERVKKALA
jgi:isoquinoline 1-oxidoreductase subunit beta